MEKSRFGYLAKVAVLAAVYFVTARIGLSIDAVSGFATLVWPPTGIALAGLLIFGYRLWPGIMIAAFLANFVMDAPLLVALGISAGNTLEALCGAYLLKRFVCFQNSLDRLSDVLGLIFLAAAGSTIISATIGVSSLLLGDVIPTASITTTWVTWWVGDMLGNLVVAPLILVWSRRPHSKIYFRQVLEGVLLALSLIFISVFVFDGFQWTGIRPFTFGYIIFPLMIWISLRFGQRGSATATFTVSVIAIWGTITGFDPSAGGQLSHRLLVLQNFIGVTAVTFMTMAAVVTERSRTQKHQVELRKRMTTLARQRSRLVDLYKAKDDFISLASHQLRTPATGVKQYLGMLLNDFAGKLSPDQREMLQEAYDSNERQINIVDDLLRVAQIDAGKVILNKKNTDLVKLTRNVIDEQSDKFKERKQSIQLVSSKPTLFATVDPNRIRMVLENVIDNASKYTHPGKIITVNVTKETSNLAIQIQDEGVGIAQKDIYKVFQKFSRIDNPLSHAAGGTGLGLYWVEKIVHLHKGTIEVQSRLHKGSTFVIKLPLPRK